MSRGVEDRVPSRIERGAKESQGEEGGTKKSNFENEGLGHQKEFNLLGAKGEKCWMTHRGEGWGEDRVELAKANPECDSGEDVVGPHQRRSVPLTPLTRRKRHRKKKLAKKQAKVAVISRGGEVYRDVSKGASSPPPGRGHLHVFQMNGSSGGGPAFK